MVLLRLAVGFQFTEEQTALVAQHMDLHPELKDIAEILSQSLGLYDAVHIRFLDGKYDPRAEMPSARWFANRMLSIHRNETLLRLLESGNNSTMGMM